MRRVLSLVLALSLLLIGGCWDRLIIEELALAFGIGIDIDPDNPEMFRMSIVNPSFSDTAKEKVNRLAAKGYSLPSIFFALQRQYDRELVLGQIIVAVFSEEAARRGLLHSTMRQIDQERDINPNVKILVVRGATAQEVIYLEPSEDERLAKYLSNLLEKNYDTGAVPRVTAFQYLHRYNTAGIDPIVPIVELTGPEGKENGVVLTGLAAIDATGRMKGTLTDQQMILFLYLTESSPQGRLATKLNIAGELRDTSLFVKHVDLSMKATVENGRPRIAIEMALDVDIIDIRWDVNVIERQDVDAIIGKALARDIQGNSLELIKQTQEWGTDILGLGQHMRVQNPEWFRNKDWSKEYSQGDITLQVKVRVMRTGTLSNPDY